MSFRPGARIPFRPACLSCSHGVLTRLDYSRNEYQLLESQIKYVSDSSHIRGEGIADGEMAIGSCFGREGGIPKLIQQPRGVTSIYTMRKISRMYGLNESNSIKKVYLCGAQKNGRPNMHATNFKTRSNALNSDSWLEMSPILLHWYSYDTRRVNLSCW